MELNHYFDWHVKILIAWTIFTPRVENWELKFKSRCNCTESTVELV